MRRAEGTGGRTCCGKLLLSLLSEWKTEYRENPTESPAECNFFVAVGSRGVDVDVVVVVPIEALLVDAHGSHVSDKLGREDMLLGDSKETQASITGPAWYLTSNTPPLSL